jgi:hypothetical protein
MVLMAFSLLAGCAAKSAQKQPSQSAGPPSVAQAQAEPEHTCADCECGGDFGSAKVTAENTDTGAALTFTTTEDKVADLRTRVQHMAEMHEREQSGDAQPARTAESDVHQFQHAHGGRPMQQGMPQQQEGLHTMQDGMPGQRHAMPMHDAGMVPSIVTVEQVPGGARLRFTPRDMSKLEQLRQHVQAHAQRMQEGGCDMMEEQLETGNTVGVR